jgi:hypothetical protein
MYTEIQQETLDIDWFFTNNENIGFVPSLVEVYNFGLK